MKAVITLVALLLNLFGCSLAPCNETPAPAPETDADTVKAATEAPAPEEPVEPLPKIIASADGTVTCRSGSDIRMSAIQRTGDGGCRLIYERGEQRRVIVEHKAGPGNEYCQQAQQRFTMNLIRSGFSCE